MSPIPLIRNVSKKIVSMLQQLTGLIKQMAAMLQQLAGMLQTELGRVHLGQNLMVRELVQQRNTMARDIDLLKMSQGAILTELNRTKTSRNLRDYDFKVFSQWGEDGIIQKLIHSVEIKNKTFIEFGVEDFTESNCRFLLMKDFWKGFVIDGSKENMDRLRSFPWYWMYELKAVESFITRENINDLLAQSGFDSDLGLLSIDVDGVDYFILETIEYFRPRILILEYNAVFGAERKISVPYDAAFFRTKKHYSNLYFGASLPALTHLANKKGYVLVGTTASGGNAFFVRSDLMTDALLAHTAAEGYTASTWRESRDPQGNLSLISGEKRYDAIRGLPVINVETGQMETL